MENTLPRQLLFELLWISLEGGVAKWLNRADLRTFIYILPIPLKNH
ncbi:hypothetical protein [Maridesulfovibrio sp.]|nr:hypothetical protein [Maridesulfovibrio sp.]